MNEDYRILITGASGLIGSALVGYIAGKWRKGERECRVYAAGRDIQTLKVKFGSGVECVAYDALRPVDFNVKADVVVHAASAASPERFVQNPVETMWANVFGIRGLTPAPLL